MNNLADCSWTGELKRREYRHVAVSASSERFARRVRSAMVFVTVCASLLAVNALVWAVVDFGIRKRIESEQVLHRESDLVVELLKWFGLISSIALFGAAILLTEWLEPLS